MLGSIADLQALIPESGPTNCDHWRMVLEAADNWIKKSCCFRTFEAGTFTEKGKTTKDGVIFTVEKPITTLTSITLADGYELVADDYEEDDDNGIITTIYPDYEYEIIYDGGYAAEDIPGDIKMALGLVANAFHLKLKQGIVDSTRAGSVSVTILDFEKSLESAKKILQPYIRMLP